MLGQSRRQEQRAHDRERGRPARLVANCWDQPAHGLTHAIAAPHAARIGVALIVTLSGTLGRTPEATLGRPTDGQVTYNGGRLRHPADEGARGVRPGSESGALRGSLSTMVPRPAPSGHHLFGRLAAVFAMVLWMLLPGPWPAMGESQPLTGGPTASAPERPLTSDPASHQVGCTLISRRQAPRGRDVRKDSETAWRRCVTADPVVAIP